MNLKKIRLVAIALLPVSMLITNPNKEAYAHYASQKILNEVPEILCQEDQKCRVWVKQMKPLSQTVITPIIESISDRRNLGVFSIYFTEIPGAQYKTIAAFGNFVTFSVK